MNATDPAFSDGTLEVIERTAQRWASTRLAAFLPVDARAGSEFPDALLDELRQQGWLPASAEEMDAWSPRTMACLGQGLGHDAGAAFLSILTHVAAAHLLPGSVFPTSESTPLLATSPFWDFSQVKSPVAVLTENGKMVLKGKLPMVVDAKAASLFVVPASNPKGDPVIAVVEPTKTGVVRREPRPTLGLRGPLVRTVEFDSVCIDDRALQGEAARKALANASQVLAWGTVGLLSGIAGTATQAATEYAKLRHQGGKPIAEHDAVARLLHAAQCAKRQLEIWLRCHGEREALLTTLLGEARRAALTATDAALQVFGGIGYTCPSVAERCWRDARQAAALCSTRVYFPQSH